MFLLRNTAEIGSCEQAHSVSSIKILQCDLRFHRGRAISKSRSFSDCVILDKDAFDPDEVFLDDIVDDEVLPRLSLAVDGLTTDSDGVGGRLEMGPEGPADQSRSADTTMPVAGLGPEQLEVYGWESSLWRKFRGYLGF